MAEPENLVLEHLRSIRGERAKLADYMETLSTEMGEMHKLIGALAKSILE